MRFIAVLSCLFATFLGVSSHAGEVTVAVASNFTGAMKEIAGAFEKQSGHRVKLSFGSSGKFYAQIRNGAPFEVFLSADQAKPAALDKDGLTVAGSRFSYAIGALALWSSDAKVVDNGGGILKRGTFRKIAIANPKLAPYGVAATQVLDALGLTDIVRGKLVMGENISQTFQFVGSGNAEIGFVALSQVMQGNKVKAGSAWIVPPELYQPIRQDAVLLKRGEANEAAGALLSFLRSEQAGRIITSFGYRVPTDD
ncbi:molybdate ABC transporter substrate-binding protein [Emcibacter nanhaiensis]|uniref:Molybdate ABC transporter substrate-binding protein n=1 Tax=Emcibacter nanhaiensis TaxID=1505037 RepID=A0A501PB48_9PROT|nr:molybdate ABC transporter substrate-binding protein [Emcibacter nanhaiensis]TPD57267.1 molybdate ABC transporter substrate-binding protein [Emcibacter nanhaiensis]